MKSTRRALSVAGISGTAAAFAAGAGVSWYYSSRLTEPPADLAVAEPEPHDVVDVVEVRGDVVVLSGADAGRPGVWGLHTADGYVRIHEVIAASDSDTEASGEDDPDAGGGGTVTRRLEPIRGGLVPGTVAVLDGYAYPPDPTTLHPDAHEVLYDSGVGPAPAWFVPGTSSTWVIAVHGRSAERHEAFRLAPTAMALGHPVLAISYRNDRDAPRSPDNRSHLGFTEWIDVEAAIDHALTHGATDVVLVGYSMGGACAVACVRNSDRAQVVRGLILDAPVLDWGPVVHRAARERGLPAVVLTALLPATMALARARVGIDWSELRSDPAALAHPTLLIHGDADGVVPVELSDALAHARPDVVTYLRVPGADHVRSWNADPHVYEMSVRCFLEALA